jgi:hypothetical protein
VYTENAVPGFGKKLKPEPYYIAVDGILKTLRPAATLRVMADKLNAVGLTTPTGKPWDRQKVSCYMRKRSI